MNFLGNFFLTYIQPHAYLWEPLLKNAAKMTAAKYLTLAIWIIYWVSFLLIKKSSTAEVPGLGTNPNTVDPRSKRPMIWAIVLHFILYSFFWLGIGEMRLFSEASRILLYPLFFTVGVILIVFGLLFSIASRYYLVSRWSFLTITSLNRPFIKEGPYKYVRHPIYLGLLAIWFGASLIFFNWIGILSGLFLLWPLLVHRAKIEEENLIKTFGVDYQSHKESSGLLFPKFF